MGVASTSSRAMAARARQNSNTAMRRGAESWIPAVWQTIGGGIGMDFPRTVTSRWSIAHCSESSQSPSSIGKTNCDSLYRLLLIARRRPSRRSHSVPFCQSTRLKMYGYECQEDPILASIQISQLRVPSQRGSVQGHARRSQIHIAIIQHWECERVTAAVEDF